MLPLVMCAANTDTAQTAVYKLFLLKEHWIFEFFKGQNMFELFKKISVTLN